MEKQNVLLVDDDPMVLNVLENILSIYPHFKIHKASTVCSAIKMIMDFDPDIIFCDLMLGKLNADDLYKTVKRYNIDERFVFISGTSKGDLDDQLLNVVENKFFLNKPFSPNEIRSHLTRLV